MRNFAYGQIFEAVKNNLTLFGFNSEECRKVAVLEEWEGMCKAHNAIGYKNFITNKTKSISKQTISKQQYDATSVIAVLSARNTANAPPKKIQKRTLNTIAFPLKSVPP